MPTKWPFGLLAEPEEPQAGLLSEFITPEPRGRLVNALLDFYNKGGVSGLMGMQPADQAIGQSFRLAEALRAKGAPLSEQMKAGVNNPLAMMFGVGTVGNVGAKAGAVTLEGLADALKAKGFRIDHTSKDAEGVARSHYLSPSGQLNGKEVRISDHDLGTKNGERQGGKWSTNIVIDPNLSLDDHLQALLNEDYRNAFSEGYSYAEWLAGQG